VHLLKSNRKNEQPQRLLFFDTETAEKVISDDLHTLNLKLGVACYVENRNDRGWKESEWLKFNTKDQFVDFVLDHLPKKSKLYLIAHNLAFDAQVLGLFPSLREREFELVKLINNQTTNVWTFKRETSTLICLDNMNFFHCSLKALGESIGVLKSDMPEMNENDQTWFAYCEQDVKVMTESWRLWLEFLRDHDLGNFGLTIASQAFNAFRHRFMMHEILVHNNETAIEVERNSYHGGRCECFFIGKLPKNDYYQLDINSMYPAVMCEYKYPVKLKSCVRELPLSSLNRLLERYCLISRVVIKTDLPVYPVRYNNRLCFPVGEFETTLTTEELRYAQYNDHLVHVGRTAIYTGKEIFKGYVDYFYTCRRDFEANGNLAFAFLCKLMLNSLYGKFGQRSHTWEKVCIMDGLPDGTWSEWDIEKQRLINYRVINGVVEKDVGEIEGYNSLVAVAAEVTANARMYLWELIKKAGRKHVYYCDTDSLLVDTCGYARLGCEIDQMVLGKLKVVDQSTTGEIFNLKSYTFGRAHKLKGVKSNAEQIDPHTFVQWQFQGINGAIRRGTIDQMHLTRVCKHIDQEYHKGVVQPDGRVIPFSFPMP
jgi:hypothetical protein